jgi:BASS family bile acid:Na+ symporter
MPHFKAKALCFEIGMENGGLAMALALAHLAPLAFIPAAIFNLIHNLTGPTLANYWREKEEKEAAAAENENSAAQ